MIYLPILILSSYLILSDLLTRYYRKQIKLVIHVNGIRGKSTIVRMLDAVFREHGYQTFSKVTGTSPRYIGVDGIERDIKRINANILEQRRFLKKAAKEKADVLIIECMALKPELQTISEKFLCSDIAIISNVKIDHLEVMGENHYQIARTLLRSARNNQKIIVGDKYIVDKYSDQYTDLIMANSYRVFEGEHKSNTDIVFELVNDLKLDNKKAKRAIKNYNRDIGVSKTIDYQGSKVSSSFAVNDFESTIDFYKKYKSILESEYKDKDEVVWFNDRMDRPYRSKLFIKWLVKISPYKIILSGDRLNENRKNLKKLGYKGLIVDIKNYNSLGEYIFGMGNIKGLDRIISEE